MKKIIWKILSWIDDNINHKIVEEILHILGARHKFVYWVWDHTCYSFCYWVNISLEDWEN